MQNPILIQALNYLSLGYSVIPLKPGSKEPLIKWSEFQQRRACEIEIKEWFKHAPAANLGMVTGRISNVVIIDLDGLEGIQTAASLGLTSSLVSLTGNGRQLWYRHPGQNVIGSIRLQPGLDIRGDGNYVVVPPSIHPNGKRYRWRMSHPLNINAGISLPSFPINLLSAAVAGNLAGQEQSKNTPGWISKALEEMKIGNIDDTLFKVCSRLRNDGYTEQDARVLLAPHAKRTGATDTHLEDKIRNVWERYEPRQRPMEQRKTTNEALVLHSPTNPDSLIEYDKLTTGTDAMERLETGYKTFDLLTKGLKKGEVLTVAARTGVGKTNWIITPIKTFCEQRKKVLLFSTEMSFDQIWQRYKSTMGTESKQFNTHQFYICDEFTPDIARIEEAIKHVQPDLFVFDHISHIGTDYHIISKFMSEIKRFARLYGIPAIVTAQLNRHADYVEQGARIEPRLSMIQGSDQIGQMSAQVLLLNEKRIVDSETEIEGIVVKNRHGDRGMIQFMLKRNPYRMVEL